jgi:tetratricopeptide (TPR) repeat protein
MKALKYIPIVMIMMLVTSCDLVTPDDIINPNVDENAFLHSDNPMETWVNGTEKELALHMSDFVELMEILSDNYFNNYTRSSKVFDIPQLLYNDADVTTLQRHVGALREMADYGLTTVAAADAKATDAQRFHLLWVKAYSHLLAGDFFRALPTKNGGPAVEWDDHLRAALQVLEQALPLAQSDEDRAFVHTLAARAAHRLGDRQLAVTHANQALSLQPNLLHQVQFDSKNGVVSRAQEAIWSDWFQPLPRLDFLDPKYYQMTSNDQCPITLAKAEENYLILAEAALAGGNLSETKAQLTALLTLVKARPVQTGINDQLEGRYNGGLKVFPNDPAYRVQASPNDPLRSGLIIDRRPPMLINIPYISGTSVTQEMIDALTDHNSALEMLYLMRQEIFFAEGRRPADLGIRLPLCEVEAAHASNGAEYTQAWIPSFIPLNGGMDDFTIDSEAMTVTIAHNMNRVIVDNARTKDVAPFE